jgi:membrane-bound ClpP family serine protease
MFESKSVNCIFNGIVALSLSLIMWRYTGNLWGWLALFLPGAVLIFYGWYLSLKED